MRGDVKGKTCELGFDKLSLIGHTSNMAEKKVRITITIDPELLGRVDGVCEARGEPRSSLIERVLSNEIKEEEEFVGDMENPVLRALLMAFKSSAALMKLSAKIAGETLTPEEVRKISEVAREQIERGKVREGGKRGRSGRELEGS